MSGIFGIGHRRSYSVDKKDLPSNQLFSKMADFIESIRPKLFLFENVKGILSGRWTTEELRVRSGPTFGIDFDKYPAIRFVGHWFMQRIMGFLKVAREFCWLGSEMILYYLRDWMLISTLKMQLKTKFLPSQPATHPILKSY